MGHLDDTTVEELHDALENVEGKKPTQRLLAAIAYKHGVTQTELAEWHDVERRTIYSWLERFDAASPERAVVDAPRPGRPRKLSAEQRQAFERTVREPPTAVGYDAETWTPALVQRYLAAVHDVEYSLPSCRRLMKEAGLRYRPSDRTAGRTDHDGEDSTGGPGRRGGRWVPE